MLILHTAHCKLRLKTLSLVELASCYLGRQNLVAWSCIANVGTTKRKGKVRDVSPHQLESFINVSQSSESRVKNDDQASGQLKRAVVLGVAQW